MKPKASAKNGMDSRIPTTSRLQVPTRITKAKTQLAMNPTGIKRKNENLAPGLAKVAKTVTKLSPSKVQESVATLTKPATTITLAKTKSGLVGREPLSTRSRTGLDLNGTKGIANKSVVNRVATGASKATSTVTNAAKRPAPPSTSGDGKAKAPAAKRIPPYDFKARFYDLMEKHQALKTKHENLKEELGELADLPERYDQTKTELDEALKTIDDLQEERDGLQIKNNSLVSTLTETQESLKILEEKCPKLEKEVKDLTKQCTDVQNSNRHLTDQNEQLTKKTSELTEEVERCAEQLFRANYERKELHNMVSFSRPPEPF